ncbi:hypothetical protein CMUS01_16038 [Colletotrichum musicola]|uniref:Uncharacterized protein n=1 Tax=Colletotrichum musicola TaxID=2175873 RepID=A0A8H6IRQ8_9PEZI|nr:hypothetical protein CMUS01_16038 [Colletotrichum musicola]
MDSSSRLGCFERLLSGARNTIHQSDSRSHRADARSLVSDSKAINNSKNALEFPRHCFGWTSWTASNTFYYRVIVHHASTRVEAEDNRRHFHARMMHPSGSRSDFQGPEGMHAGCRCYREQVRLFRAKSLTCSLTENLTLPKSSSVYSQTLHHTATHAKDKIVSRDHQSPMHIASEQTFGNGTVGNKSVRRNRNDTVHVASGKIAPDNHDLLCDCDACRD